MQKILVTGGAGFIGSHVVDYLMKRGLEVNVIDNLSTGKLENIKTWIENKKFKLFIRDLLEPKDISEAIQACDTVFHLAANPEVRVGIQEPKTHFDQNVMATFNLLETMRKINNIKTLVFTSSSTVYGDALTIPTPESYSPLIPISIYGASKLACEALITSYCHNYGFKSVIYRLANIVGPRSAHGVIYDFIKKLRTDQNQLEILGDGAQIKSYLCIDDCIEAMFLGLKQASDRVEIFNLGSEDWINVKKIAEIIIDLMEIKNVEINFTGGVNGGRGWMGDVKKMLLSIDKLKALGWQPKYNSEQSIKMAVKAALDSM